MSKDDLDEPAPATTNSSKSIQANNKKQSNYISKHYNINNNTHIKPAEVISQAQNGPKSWPKEAADFNKMTNSELPIELDSEIKLMNEDEMIMKKDERMEDEKVELEVEQEDKETAREFGTQLPPDSADKETIGKLEVQSEKLESGEKKKKEKDEDDDEKSDVRLANSNANSSDKFNDDDISCEPADCQDQDANITTPVNRQDQLEPESRLKSSNQEQQFQQESLDCQPSPVSNKQQSSSNFYQNQSRANNSRKQHQQQQQLYSTASSQSSLNQQHNTISYQNQHLECAQQVPPVSADYLAQLIKDKKQLAAFPSIFIHVQRLVDEEINKVRQSLFQLNDVVHLEEPLELPEPEGEPVQLQEKLYVPVGEHPEYNFVGRLLGPRGMTAKQLEQETGCKIMIRGRGSMRDKKKEEQNRGKANWEHLNDKLHVLITVEDTQKRAEIKLSRALEEVKQLLVPIVDGEDELKKRQLMELAIINGTYRECNYNETLTKMLNDNTYRQPGESQQLQQQQPTSLQQASTSGNQYHHAHQVSHQMAGNSGSSPNANHANATAVVVAAAAAAAAAAAQHNANHQLSHHHQANSASGISSPLHATSVMSAGPPNPNSHAPLHHHHHQHTQSPGGMMTAAAAAAAPPPPPPPPPPNAEAAMIYAQQYHDFQHYAAIAAAAGQPLLHPSEYHPHAHHGHPHLQAPVPISTAPHHPNPAAAAAVAQAVAAAAVANQQQQQQQHQQQFHQPVRSDHHHLAAAAAAAALAYQQQIHQHHHQLLQEQHHQQHHLHHHHHQQQQQQQQQQQPQQSNQPLKTGNEQENENGNELTEFMVEQQVVGQVDESQPELCSSTGLAVNQQGDCLYG